jgi:hypothetical protein
MLKAKCFLYIAQSEHHKGRIESKDQHGHAKETL